MMARRQLRSRTPREFRLRWEPEWVADLDEQRRRRDRSDARLVTKSGSTFIEKPIHFLFEPPDFTTNGSVQVDGFTKPGESLSADSGAMWFTERVPKRVGRIDMNGKVT
jgi:hypothetical protein